MLGLPEFASQGILGHAAVPRILRRLALAGTGSFAPRQRRGLVVANLTGYLAAVSSLAYALTYWVEDFSALSAMVYGNLASAAATAATPLFHRFGRAAATLWLALVIFTSVFYFISVLGHDAGIQLNYIGAAAVALVLDQAFLNRLYFISATNIMAIVFVLVWYALQLARQAEERTDALLCNILPATIAERLREKPDAVIAERFEAATVLFADLTGFTTLAARLGPQKIVAMLDDLFSAFDDLAARHGLEKIKTIGDAYMAVAGVPVARPGHAQAVADMALAMLEAAAEVGARHGETLKLHVGIASGPVMAGIIGRTRFSYDVWGDTVNLAARLEAWGRPGTIVASAGVEEILRRSHAFEPLGKAELKGIGEVGMFRLVAAKEGGGSD